MPVAPLDGVWITPYIDPRWWISAPRPGISQAPVPASATRIFCTNKTGGYCIMLSFTEKKRIRRNFGKLPNVAPIPTCWTSRLITIRSF